MEKTPLKFIGHYVRIFKWLLLLMMGCILVRQGANAIEPYFLAKIYDAVAGPAQGEDYWHKIFTYAGITAAIALISMTISESSAFLEARFLPKLRTMVLRDAFEDVNRQSIAYFSREMTGNVSNKVHLLANNTLDAFGYSHEVFHIFSRVSAGIVLLSWVSWYYTVLLLVWISLIVAVSVRLGKIRRKLGKETGRLSSAANGVVVDALSNYSEIKSFANFSFEKYNLLKSLRQLRKAETREKTIMGYIRITQQFLTIASFIGFIFFSIFMFKNGRIDATQFIFANTLFMGISGTAFQLSWAYNSISRIFGNMSSALETLAVEPEIVDRPDARDLPLRKSKIVFDRVSFGYNGNNPLFRDLSVEIGAGEKVGLVGLSGSGKSTFVKLISRYYDVTGGAVRINGHDIRDITQNSLHRNIAVIPQDVCLFNRTLAENIRYGKTNASDRQVQIAAQKAFADIFIREFPDGYQTKVGDRGVILSGGERQRIAIARAILKNAPILIFDEATSALDSESERHIQKSLQNLMKGKTVLAIAHRLSTLREMDRILVFDKGRIIESGTHEQLLRKKGQYHKLFTMQVDGFVGS